MYFKEEADSSFPVVLLESSETGEWHRQSCSEWFLFGCFAVLFEAGFPYIVALTVLELDL